MEKIREKQHSRFRALPKLQKKKTGNTVRTQALLCFFIFLFCLFIHFSPADQNTVVKNSIALILNHNTDLKKTWEKLASSIKKEPALESLSPVSEMIAPTSGEIQKDFGMQDAEKEKFHYGVLLSVPDNENIISVYDGEITEIATNEDYGTHVYIKHSEEIVTLYANLGEVMPNVGDKVRKGQPIAKSENGTLYFELKKGDTYLDPSEFISFGEAKE